MPSLLRLSLIVVLLTAAGCASSSRAYQGTPSDRDAVVQVVNDLFDAMRRQDGQAMRALHMPEVALVRVPENAAPTVRLGSPDAFINSIVNAPAEPRERMWDAEVRIDGNLATLWAPYDFHLGDNFSHCGVDALQLVRTNTGWRIASIAYTVHREDCDHAPPP